MFKSFIRRRKKPESRIHIELTEKSRERIASITNFAESWHMEDALKKLQDDIGLSEIKKFFRPYSDGSGLSPNNTHHYLINSANKEIVFSYLELFLKITFNAINNQGFSIRLYYNEDFLLGIYQKLKAVLIEEGILWELKMKKDEQDNYYFKFIEISSVMQKKSDEELQTIYLGTEWEKYLKSYNEAYKIFLSGANSFVIPEKLYNAFEEVAKKISLDKKWNLKDKISLSKRLEKMKEENIFGDKSIFLEINELTNLLIKYSSKIGGDRKRHKNIDEYTCNLLLHQASAWLTYIIKKYGNNK